MGFFYHSSMTPPWAIVIIPQNDWGKAMVTTNNEKSTQEEDLHDLPPPLTLTKNTATDKSNKQILLHNKFITHHPKSGINPLVDAAAYLFSTIGKLKQLTSHRNLTKLQKDLIAEINTFQETAKAHGYSSEYILVSRYALCATIDDIISSTPWGNQGQWDHFSVLSTFNQEAPQNDRFFLILERIIKDPTLYIDVMELMYICLSLGYKGTYRSTEFSNNQLEKMTHSLYKHIRAHHGDYSKTLSPFSVRIPKTTKKTPKTSFMLTFLITTSIIMSIFIGLSYLQDTISNQAYKELMHIGKSILYETNT